MRINNNIMALNAHRQLGVNQANSSKSMERLSSGMRINRAGDDAAGLAISEKMRGQIRGLKQAQRNAQDGISLIQTAEGALNETHAILQRMRELATQSANDTNTPEDRVEIQKEIDQLAQEITRISTDTEFNTKPLLTGDLDVIFHIGANEAQNINLTINPMDAESLGVRGEVYTAQPSGITGLDIQSLTGEAVTIKVVASQETNNPEVAETTASFEDGTITITLAQAAGNDSAAGAITAKLADVKAALESVAGDAGIVVIEGTGFNGNSEATSVTTTLTNWEIDEDASAKVGINV